MQGLFFQSQSHLSTMNLIHALILFKIFEFQPQSACDIQEDTQEMHSTSDLQLEEVADVKTAKTKPPPPKPSPFRILSPLPTKDEEEEQEEGDREEERLAKGMSKDESFKSELYTVDFWSHF